MRVTCCVAFTLLFALVAAPAQALRCDGRLISDGDPKGRVLSHCGEPTSIERRVAVRRAPAVRLIEGRLVSGPAVNLEEVTIETWLYNFGPRRLMRELRFENGRLVRIERLGYGYHK